MRAIFDGMRENFSFLVSIRGACDGTAAIQL